MAKEILNIVEALSNEKAIEREQAFQALEAALSTATKKKFEGLDVDIKTDIDRKTGEFIIKRRWLVVDTDGPLENPSRETTFAAAQIDEPDINPGGYIEELLDAEQSVNSDPAHKGIFDRITAQTVKQVLQQQLKEAERLQVIKAFTSQVSKVVVGVVKRVSRDAVFLDLGNNAEAVLRRQSMLSRDLFRPGDRVRSLLLPIRDEPSRGGQLLEVSRTSPEFLKELLTIEVPEIGEGQLEIISAVRDPGSRSKVSVRAKDRRIDPRGACIGMRGSRIKNVSDELCHEKVDIIVYDDDFSKYVINAMEPAEVKKVIVDEPKSVVYIGVDKTKYALAIGTNGQNVRLATQLIGSGWHIRVMTVEEMDQKENDEISRTSNLFVDALNIDSDSANALVDAGFTSVEEIAYISKDELVDAIGIDPEQADVLQKVAKETLKNVVSPDGKKADEALLELPEMDYSIARSLATHNILSIEDLAECASDDLTEDCGLDKKKADVLIMSAREAAGWFKDSSSETAEVSKASDEAEKNNTENDSSEKAGK